MSDWSKYPEASKYSEATESKDSIKSSIEIRLEEMLAALQLEQRNCIIRTFAQEVRERQSKLVINYPDHHDIALARAFSELLREKGIE